MTVKLNDIEIKDWLDYVHIKFADNSLYDIDIKKDGDVLIKSKTNKTTIWFYINEDLTLSDCQYYNADCRGWSGETLSGDHESGIFNQKNVDNINSVLQTPINNGWLSVDYYLGDSVLQSKTFYDMDKNSTPFVNVREYGCFALIFFPVFWLLIKLVDVGLLGHKKETIVKPILTTTR